MESRKSEMALYAMYDPIKLFFVPFVGPQPSRFRFVPELHVCVCLCEY